MEKTEDECLGWLLIVGTGVLGVAALCVLKFWWPPTNNEGWAAWVQAVGSIWAIAAAVGVSTLQAQATRRQARDQAEEVVQNALQAIRDEIEVLWEGFQLRVGARLIESQRGTVFNYWWPPPDEPFVIYKATAVVVGSIDDDDLRRAIVRAYSRAEGVLITFRVHNKLLHEREALGRLVEQNIADPLPRRRFAEATVELVAYDDQLRDMYADLRDHVETVLRLLPHRNRTGAA